MALWRTRTLTPDQKAQIAEEQQDREVSMLEDAGSLLDVEDAKMSRVCVAELPINVSHFASHLLNKITQCTYEHTIFLNKVQTICYSSCINKRNSVQRNFTSRA